ncbi:MAG: MFS transporter [Gemmatimonadetes bacterium]|nr:MFS transporter [Gemmatimonadota bacterium]
MKRISVLMATAFVDMIGYALVFPLLPFYALRFNADVWQIGWLIAAFPLLQLMVAPMWGRFSDRYGRRPAILLGLLTSAFAFLVFSVADSILMLFISRSVQGIGGGTTAVVQAYVGDAIAPKDRAKAYGWLSAATAAGVVIGPVIGSLSFGLGPEYPGRIAAGLCFTSFLFAGRWLREPRPHDVPTTDPNVPAKKLAAHEGKARREAGPRRSIREVVIEVLTHPGREVPRLIWIYAVGMLGFMSMAAVMSLFLKSRFGVNERTIGLFFAYMGVLGFVMRAIVLGKAVDRFRETRVMRAGAISLAIGLFAIPLPTFLIGTAIVMSFVPIGTALLFPNQLALVSFRTPNAELGQMLGVQQWFGGVARVIAPLWATAVFQLGPSLPFFISAGVVALMTLLAFSVKPMAAAAEAL